MSGSVGCSGKCYLFREVFFARVCLRRSSLLVGGKSAPKAYWAGAVFEEHFPNDS